MEGHPYFHQKTSYRGLKMEDSAGSCHIPLRALVSGLPMKSSLSLRTQ
jgi:hypothetical protein